MKNIYIARHGQTNGNVAGLVQGQTSDIPLNEAGINQAIKLAEKSRDIKMDIIFTSPLSRARVTAETVAKSKNIPVIIDAGLLERNDGIAEGEKMSSLPADDLDKWLRCEDNEFRWIDGESRLQLMERALKTINNIVGLEYENIGIVSHSGFISALLLGLGKTQIAKDIPNAEFIHIVYDNGKLKY